MPDYSLNNKIYRPSNYDEGYRQLATPYHYQNINISKVKQNVSNIEKELYTSITGLNELNWFRVINTVDYENELNGTFERTFAIKYGELIQKYYGSGNWNLLVNPEISISAIRNAGYDFDYEESVLYPQSDLFWNSYYNRYFAIWYTPIQKDKTIISKKSAISYIKQLSKTSSYILKDEKGIILKASDELGFSPQDIMSLNTDNPSNRAKQTLNDLSLWSEALNKAQLLYFDLINSSNSEKLEKKYLFIDEDKSIFNTIRNTYLVFRVNEAGYYNDLHPDLKSGLPDYWDSTKDYKTGDFVLGTNSDSDDSKYNYLYCCLCGYKAKEQDGKFHRTITVTVPAVEEWEIVDGRRVLTRKKGEVAVNQWYYVTDAYAKEIEAIQKVKSDFNPEDWIRFSLPAMEDERAIEYYPNGKPKPNGQEGTVYWGKTGITLREVHHHKYDETDETEDNEERKKIDYYNYSSIYETDLDRSEPLDPYLFEEDEIEYKDNPLVSPSDYNENYYNCSKKLIRYFKKDDVPFITFIKIDCKMQSIKEESFKDRTDLLKVVFYSDLHKIGARAFSGCSELLHVLLPQNLKVLGENAFASCSSLKYATIPPNVTSIYAAYIGCTSLQSVVLSENCSELRDSSFANCINLKKIYNTSNIEKLGANVFNGCENLLDFTVPKKVKELPARLFKNCKKAKIQIDCEVITELGESCFEGCEQITEAVSFENLTQLEPKTYKDCINLTSISFNFGADAEKIIPEQFCSGCYRLTNIDLGAATQIDSKAFLNCAALEVATIPQTVTKIGASIFYDCFHLGQLKVPLYITDDQGRRSSWIESVLDDTNKTNWIDSLFTKVTDYNGVEIEWTKMIPFL